MGPLGQAVMADNMVEATAINLLQVEELFVLSGELVEPSHQLM